MDWRKDFDKKFDGLWLFLATEYKSFDAGKAPKESIKSFIENLLEQERKRVSDEIGELYPTMDSNEARRGYDQARADILFIINKK